MLESDYWKKVLLIVAIVGMCWPAAVQAQTIETLVSAGSIWKYDDTNTDLYGVGWPSVDDTEWSSGPAPLGFGDPHIVTAMTINSPRHTCYFRHTFTIGNPSVYESLTLRILRDDGCVVYLNGTEVARSNMPGGEITHDTWSSAVVGGADETAYFEFSVNPAMLVAGDNVFAVDVHQCNETSSDLGFDLELEATVMDPYSPYDPVLIAPGDGASNVSTSPTLEVTVSDPDGDALDVAFYGRSTISGAEEFVIVALPDTQKYVNSTGNPLIFTSQTQWVVDNGLSQNIVFVTHEGDITDSTDYVDNAAVVEAEWIRANDSMSLLDGVVPYGLCPGNHDKPGAVPDFYNVYFPYTRYEGNSWYGGHYPASGNDNNYETFSAGGMDFILLHLQVYPNQDVFDWANSVLSGHPNYIAILTMHQYLNTDGSRMGIGQTVWDQVIAPNNNVRFVFCGHNHGEAYRVDVEDDREVHQLLADYQSYPNGGNGYLRIMRFVPAEDTVYVQTYSPWLDQYETDGNSEFALDFPMGDPFSLIGSDIDVPSGGDASIVWSDLASGTDYEWFVEVTDTTNRTTVGPVWSFVTALTPEASSPDPPDGATGMDIDADLSWSPGINAVSHDVYFGTSSPPPFEQTQTETTYDPDTLAPSTTYYWRIDEFDGADTHTGNVWSFTTAPLPGPASNPSPANAATDVSIDVDLSWTAGSDATSHNVCFGTTDPPPFVRNQGGTTYDPGSLAYEATYYWAIDEIGPGGVTYGTVWSFTTGQMPPAVASGDIPVAGAVSGTYIDTHASDYAYQSITERQSGGKPSNRYSYLEHKWTFEVVSAPTVTFCVEAYKSVSYDGDDFVFAYSTDDLTYNDMVTVTKTSDDNMAQSYQLPGYVSGTIYIRVVDTDQTQGNNVLDTVYIDHMYIESQGTPIPDTTPPSPDPMTWATPPYATGSTSIAMTATTASDPSGVEYYFECITPGGHASDWQDSPTYEDTGLVTGVEYTYRVKARDKSPTQNETGWSSPASATPGEQQTVHVESIDVAIQLGKKYYATASVQIAPALAGATVVGDWYFKGTLRASGDIAVTGGDATAVLTSFETPAKSGDVFTFVVTNVVLTGYTYAPQDNLQTEDSAAVP